MYRLEPGFLIQGRLLDPGVRPNTDKRRAPKVMERGEVGWAGGGAGPDWFIYLGTGPASWLGNPHDGTIWAEVADEESMAVANNVSLLPVPVPPPGHMHILKTPAAVSASPWMPPVFEAGEAPSLGVLKVANVVLDNATARCGADCHALAHTELHGDVVRWGETHILSDASECCRACHEHAAQASNTKKCNVWVYCSSLKQCGKRYQQCWLKAARNLWSAAEGAMMVGTSDAWTSGTTKPAPEDHPSGAGRRLPRAAEADFQITVDVSLPALSSSKLANGSMLVRMRLRKAAPRAAELIRRLVDVRSGHCQLAMATGGSPTPVGWGSGSRSDGFGVENRWPRGHAVLYGRLSLPPTADNHSSLPLAVEKDPVPILRGSIAWSHLGFDGPAFFIALADMPHLGVAHTVWGEVVSEDLSTLDALAAAVATGDVQLPLVLGLKKL